MPPEKQDPKNPFARPSAWGSAHDGPMRFTPMTKLAPRPVPPAPAPEPAPAPVAEAAPQDPPRRKITPSPPVRSILTGSALPTALPMGGAAGYPSALRRTEPAAAPAPIPTPPKPEPEPQPRAQAQARPQAEVPADDAMPAPVAAPAPQIPVAPVTIRTRRRKRSGGLLVIGVGSALVVGAVALVVMMFSRTAGPPTASVAATEPAAAAPIPEAGGIAAVETASGALRGPITPRLSEARVTPQTAAPPAPARNRPAAPRIAAAPTRPTPAPASAPIIAPPPPIDVRPEPLITPPVEAAPPAPPPPELDTGLADPEAPMAKRRGDEP